MYVDANKLQLLYPNMRNTHITYDYQFVKFNNALYICNKEGYICTQIKEVNQHPAICSFQVEGVAIKKLKGDVEITEEYLVSQFIKVPIVGYKGKIKQFSIQDTKDYITFHNPLPFFKIVAGVRDTTGLNYLDYFVVGNSLANVLVYTDTYTLLLTPIETTADFGMNHNTIRALSNLQFDSTLPLYRKGDLYVLYIDV